MILPELQREAHAIALSKGWWDEERTFGDLIALVHSELSEALEAYRENPTMGTSLHNPPEAGGSTVVGSRFLVKPEGVASELADVVIRVADMAEWYGRDLSDWEGAKISHPIVEPTFGDWISLIHGNLSLAFAFLCTELEGRTWTDALKGVLRLVSDMAVHYGIDLDAAIEAKMEYNRTREYRHGGKAL